MDHSTGYNISSYFGRYKKLNTQHGDIIKLGKLGPYSCEIVKIAKALSIVLKISLSIELILYISLQTDKRFLIPGKTLKINTIITATSDKTEKCEAYFFKTTNKTTQTSAKPIKPVTVIHLKRLIIRHLIQ